MKAHRHNSDREKPRAPADAAATVLELFYPIYYQIGKSLEEVLRNNKQLSRKQVAILWLLRAEGGPDICLSRKEIQRLIGPWFEISSPSITRALRAMAQPPLRLVELSETLTSGREQLVKLTPEGKRFLTAMAEKGKRLLRPLIAQFPQDDVAANVEFLGRVVGAFRALHFTQGQHTQPQQASRRSGGRSSPRPKGRQREEEG